MGIDFPSSDKLIAANNSVERIRQIIDADSLVYQSLEGLVRSIGLRRDQLCLACLTGEYPLNINKDELESGLNEER
jgi:amidophosphoribosyltransferase